MYSQKSQPTKEQSDIKKYEKLKKNNIKNEILGILESESGTRIDIRKPSHWDDDREFDRFKFLPSMITSSYNTNRKCKKPRDRFIGLYELAKVIFSEKV